MDQVILDLGSAANVSQSKHGNAGVGPCYNGPLLNYEW